MERRKGNGEGRRRNLPSHSKGTERLPMLVLLLLAPLAALSLLPTLATAKAPVENPSICVILARPTAKYEIGLFAIHGDENITFWFQFNYSRSPAQRLNLFNASQELSATRVDGTVNWTISSSGGEVLCTLTEQGVEEVWGQRCARLLLASEDYYVRRLGVMEEGGQLPQVGIPEPIVWIIALVSLLPFFLVVPQVVDNLTYQIDVDGERRGIIGRLLGIFLPLVTVGVTLLLLTGSIDFITWAGGGTP